MCNELGISSSRVDVSGNWTCNRLEAESACALTLGGSVLLWHFNDTMCMLCLKVLGDTV